MPHRTANSGRSLLPLTLGVAVLSAAATFVVAALLMNIFERKVEARDPFFRVVEIDDDTADPAIWGKNFPLHYDQYSRTVDMERTRFGGSEAVPRTPTDADPRSIVAQSKVEEDPRLRAMWAGYAFAIDFREERGHAYMLEDQTFTRRQERPQPGACLHCHASVYNAYKDAGNGDIIKGFEKVNPLPYHEARELVTHPVACIDCHDAADMSLRITRPAFIEGIRAYKASQGIPDYDVNRDATRQEMRSFVCGQCHVEYYFRGDEKRLVYPWFKGLTAEDALDFYDETGFHDWIHAETGAKMLKAQHPEFEMWNQGVHARAGVACADCHMPYTRVGAMKISDHHIRSPLLNINNACQTCHKVPEEELLFRAENIQRKTYEMRDISLTALTEYIGAIKSAQLSGVDDSILERARDYHRKASFFIDYVEAENSMGFHAPQEAARVLFKAMEYLRLGQKTLAEDPRAAGIPIPEETGSAEEAVEEADAPVDTARL